MNHGKCEKCFWWKLKWCYMQNQECEEDSYCPDYFNRNRTKQKLEDTKVYKLKHGDN